MTTSPSKHEWPKLDNAGEAEQWFRFVGDTGGVFAMIAYAISKSKMSPVNQLKATKDTVRASSGHQNQSKFHDVALR
jgi:hypothetical protein